jgi:hypothetical protein
MFSANPCCCDVLPVTAQHSENCLLRVLRTAAQLWRCKQAQDALQESGVCALSPRT